MWFKSTGTIIYDPYRGNLKKKPDWWCVVEVDKEITRYYRSTIHNRYHLHNLCQPSWDAHISVIRGEKPKHHLRHLWKKYHGKKVEFRYKHCPRKTTDNRTDTFWFVDVDCPFLLDIRKELERPSNWSLHLTVGKTWY